MLYNDTDIFFEWRNWWKLWLRTYERYDYWAGGYAMDICTRTYSFGPLSVRTFTREDHNV